MLSWYYDHSDFSWTHYILYDIMGYIASSTRVQRFQMNSIKLELELELKLELCYLTNRLSLHWLCNGLQLQPSISSAETVVTNFVNLGRRPTAATICKPNRYNIVQKAVQTVQPVQYWTTLYISCTILYTRLYSINNFKQIEKLFMEYGFEKEIVQGFV